MYFVRETDACKRKRKWQKVARKLMKIGKGI